MATTTTTRYCYDAFGRRIAKSSSVKKSSKLGLKGNVPRFGFVSYEKPQRSTMLILWDGNRQIQELTDKFIFTTVYEQDSFEPVARLIWLQQHLQEQTKINEGKQWQELENYVIPKYQKQRLEYQSQTGIRIYHYHNDHLGTPQELTNSLGEVVWLNYSQAWGGSYETKCFAKELDNLDVSADLLQPIRFQGQFFDGETNLHYNRFRYYDSDMGMFVSRDPIELEGGLNIFSYAPNPIMWIDPFGLAKKKKVRKKTTTSESTEQENCQSPEKVVVYHFTDLKGYNAIRSQSPYLFKASSPEKGHPKGVYVTEWSPERILHKPGGFKSYLGITNEKSEYFFKFKVNKCDLLRIPGGRTHVAYINKDIKISKEDMLDKGVTPK